jgi:hypothetical protein
MQIDAFYGDDGLHQALRDGTASIEIAPMGEHGYTDLRLTELKALKNAGLLELANLEEIYVKPVVRKLAQEAGELAHVYKDNPIFKALTLNQEQATAIKTNQLAEQKAQDFVRSTSQQLDDAARYYQSKQSKLMSALNKSKGQ